MPWCVISLSLIDSPLSRWDETSSNQRRKMSTPARIIAPAMIRNATFWLGSQPPSALLLLKFSINAHLNNRMPGRGYELFNPAQHLGSDQPLVLPRACPKKYLCDCSIGNIPAARELQQSSKSTALLLESITQPTHTLRDWPPDWSPTAAKEPTLCFPPSMTFWWSTMSRSFVKACPRFSHRKATGSTLPTTDSMRCCS